MRTFPGWSRLRMTTFGTLSIDEVHPLIISRLGLAPEIPNVQRCTLNVNRRSLFQSRSNRELLLHGKRPARTPPSTFLFLPIHFSNSPGPRRPLPSGGPESRRNSTHPKLSDVGSLFQ